MDQIWFAEKNVTLITTDLDVYKRQVWLNRKQLAELFGRDVKTIGKHINNALKEELDNSVAVSYTHLDVYKRQALMLYGYISNSYAGKLYCHVRCTPSRGSKKNCKKC